MLRLWRQMAAIEPLRLDCTVERTDGPDIDAGLKREMRAWYLNLLDSGPVSALAPVDLASTAAVEKSTDGLTVITAPADARRILSVRFSGWSAPIVPEEAPANALANAANPYLRRPRVYRLSPGSVAVGGASGTLQTLMCAVDHGPQVYVLDDSFLRIKNE